MSTFRHRLFGLGLAALCAAGGVAAEGSATQPVAFKIDSQPVGSALKAFATQSGLQLLFHVEGVAISPDLKTPRVDGTLTPEVALERLLANTGLRYEFINERTVTIRSAKRGEGGSKPTADASWSGTMRLAQADAARADNSSAPTGAQATEDKPNNADSADNTHSSRLDEIIVTATKRAQNIQEVPVSIAVVSADDIDRRGLVGAEDYLRGIPGVNQVSAATGQTIVIRGIETSPNAQNYSSGTTVATYFGETPTTATGGLAGHTNIDIKLVDIERVEVLRGPQGTAFGNSSLGGVVRTIPVAPKLDRFEGKVAANYSVTAGSGGDNHMMQGVVNVPVIKDRLAIRATAYQFDDSGYYRNRLASNPAMLALATATGAPYTDEDETGAINSTGGRISALFQATDDLKFTFGYFKQTTEMDGTAVATSGTFEQAVLDVAPQNIERGQRLGIYDMDVEFGTGMMEYGFSWGNLLATYSHVNSGATYASTFSATGTALPASAGGAGPYKQDSGEIRLTTQFNGPWNFLVGFYAEDVDEENHADYYWSGSAASNPFGNQFLGIYRDVRALKQKSAFAEVSWKFLPGFTLTGGVRAYDYDRTLFTQTSGPIFGGTSAGSPNSGDASGNTFRGNLSYEFGSIGMVYAGFAQGFRLGKPQPGLPSGLCDVNPADGIVDGTGGITIASTSSVDSDTVDSFEVGGKFTLLDRRLLVTADVYRIDWSGVPVRVLPPAAPDGCGLAFNANAGDARSEGVEIQTNFYATEKVRLDLGSSWIKAELIKDAPGLVPPAFKGDRLPGSPKFNANFGVQYEFAIAGYPAFVRADSIYVGTFFGDFQESLQTESGGYVKVDASARVAIKNLDIDLFVRNLTNRDDFSFRGVSNLGQFYGYRLRPRTIGLQLGYNFQ